MKPTVLHATRAALASDVCMERGWLEAGKGGPYVPGRHPAEWGGSYSGPGFGPGRPDQPERLRETAGPGIAVARQDPSRRQAVEGIE
jgi:hypothetical protein